MKNNNQREKEEKKRKFEEWKKNAAAKRKIEQRNYIIKASFLALVLIIIYMWASGRLTFFGQKTETAKATITEIRILHWGRGMRIQNAIYQFEYEGEIYQGDFDAGRRKGKQHVGGKVKVKFSVKNPEKSKVVGFYSRSKNKYPFTGN